MLMAQKLGNIPIPKEDNEEKLNSIQSRIKP